MMTDRKFVTNLRPTMVQKTEFAGNYGISRREGTRVQWAREIVARGLGRGESDDALTDDASTYGQAGTGHSPPSSIGNSTWRMLKLEDRWRRPRTWVEPVEPGTEREGRGRTRENRTKPCSCLSLEGIEMLNHHRILASDCDCR
jgi:hypothetical protein